LRLLQGKHDNYDIDLFRALIEASEEATGVKAEGEQSRQPPRHRRPSALIRIPDCRRRAAVKRRSWLCSAPHHAPRHAPCTVARAPSDPLIWRLLPTLVQQMGRAYPELVRAESLITETLKLEETRFRKTLERGLLLLSDATSTLGKGDMLDGETAFKLYDTYGFPLDLTQDALRAREIGVDISSFTDAMERQKAEARSHWAGSGDKATETIWFELREKHGATEFLGYDTETAEGVIQAIVRDGASVASAASGDKVQIIVSQTPFYGESGGQMGDTGVITSETAKIEITDTQKKGEGLFVHIGSVVEGTVKSGDEVVMTVDHARRSRLRANHSATHLLHEALREVLGTHVAQKGSLVAPERLRFDVSHPKPMSAEELKVVEDMANEIVLQNSPVTTRLMSVDDAIAEGAMALFGEKYGDEVRVVAMGQGVRGAEGWQGLFDRTLRRHACRRRPGRSALSVFSVKVLSAPAFAVSKRSPEKSAREYLAEQDERVKALAASLKVQPGEVLSRVEALIDERRKLERELADAKRKLAMGGGQGGSADAVREVAGVKFLGKAISGVDPKDLKGLADDGKASLGSGVVTLIGVSEDGKASAVVAVTEDLVGRFSAVDLVRVASAALGGKGGGGRPDMAQAGGPDGSKADEAIEAVAVALAS
jgi:alanyl-tRNA synthetase